MIDCTITKNYFKEKARMTNMCKIPCSRCPIGYEYNGKKLQCYRFENKHLEEAIAIVQEWSDTHSKQLLYRTFIAHLDTI